MPAAAKGPRLWLEKGRLRADGTVTEGQWCIRDDGQYKRRLPYGPGDRAAAEEALASYIASKRRPATREQAPDRALIADVLSTYARERGPAQKRPKELASRIERLLHWWGAPKGQRTAHISDVNAANCRAYVEHVGAVRSAQRDLEILRAAMNYSVQQRQLDYAMPVTLPPKSLPRERWLTRQEAARLLWAAWRSRRLQDGQEDTWGHSKHVARFILASLYTGTRKTAVLQASFKRQPGWGHVDLERGVWHRQPVGTRGTTKRQPAIPIPSNLLAHMRRWARKQDYLIEYAGHPVERLDKAFRALVKELGLEDVVIHTLRHTAITWGMQNGISLFDASGYFGLSVEMISRVYGHHSPDHLRGAAELMKKARR